MYCFERAALLAALPKLANHNEQGELYLTDVLGMQVEAGETVPTVTLEDETGTANAILTPKQFQRFRVPLHAAKIVLISGPVQNVDGVIHVRAADEPVADIRVRYAPLKGIEIPGDQVPLAIDEFPVLFIAAACAEGRTVLRGERVACQGE